MLGAVMSQGQLGTVISQGHPHSDMNEGVGLVCCTQ